jgi:CheY-like chemotaxis protein
MTVVAVVDDNADIRLLLRVLLGGTYAVREYASGVEALAAFVEEPPDVVLLDISLPLLSGVEVLRRMRADARLAAVPAVALTAHARDGDRAAFLEAGFDEYVAKPIVDETVLLRAVARCVERRAGREGA